MDFKYQTHFGGTSGWLPHVILLQLRIERGNLSSRQPAQRSAKPPEEDDDAGLVSPQLLKGGLLLGDGMGQLYTSNACRIHNDNGLE